ncbi:MAG TPA: hypothetical protein VKV06_07065 [Acidimicrobiales bacterium]|nr:hypothetical protein [Acidimicrobiales bacterium]
MPWCDDCSKFWNPPSLDEGGKCPTCGAVLTTPTRSAPWHFKVLLVALVLYLIYRVYWLIEWLPKHV